LTSFYLPPSRLLAQSCQLARYSKVVTNLRYSGHQIKEFVTAAEPAARSGTARSKRPLLLASFTTPAGVTRLIKRIGAHVPFAFPIHFHMLRHACGYALANAGHDTRRIQDWLGHRSIQHTTRYMQLSAAPFKDFWR